jgi:predicted P-loop ATPase
MSSTKPKKSSAQAAQERPPTIARRSEISKLGKEEYLPFIRSELRPAFNRRSRLIWIDGRELSEERLEALHLDLAERGIGVSSGDLQAGIRSVASVNSFDPVADYLNSVATSKQGALTDEEWNRIAFLAFGLEGEFEGEILRKYLISAVARPLDPGCKVDQALVLYGGQGLKKSTFFRILAGPWFTDSMGDDTSNKDEVLKLHMAWIAEWSELDRVFAGAHKAEQVKRFVSAQDDLLRVPYGRSTTKYLRQSVLAGTTNRDDWASDHTGNRRYPVLAPLRTEEAWLEDNRDRVWGRAVAEYRKGTPWWYDAGQEAEISRIAQDYAPMDEWQAYWEAWFPSRATQLFTMKELWCEALALPLERFNKAEGARVRRSLKAALALGLQFGRRHHHPRKASHGPQGLHSVVWLP